MTLVFGKEEVTSSSLVNSSEQTSQADATQWVASACKVCLSALRGSTERSEGQASWVK